MLRFFFKLPFFLVTIFMAMVFSNYSVAQWTQTVQDPPLLYYTDGNVGIGTTSPNHLLTVNGEIKAKKLIISLNGWADNVFDDDYQLRSLKDLEIAIKRDKHLPDIPTEDQILENGADIGEIQIKLLKKIEELTLYLIEQDARIEMLENENRALTEKINN